MEFQYQETTNDLATRIDIHQKFGAKDIDQWMLDLLKLQKGAPILDVGCGAGKQCFSFFKYLDGNCTITGGDVSESLLEQARSENAKYGNKIHFIELNFDRRFPVSDKQFDLVSCCFAIYYARDISFTIREMHRVLRTGGRLFTTGPMPANKRLFYDIIAEATGKPIPPMPGSSRYGSHILSAMQAIFSKVDVNLFENPLTFETVEPFMDYTRASLSEDRKLWNDFFTEPESFEQVMSQIRSVAERRLKKEGKLVMTKVVGGFVATK
jgi:ubiquinone/menaquinone biosynthesis C-methylase UbiE